MAGDWIKMRWNLSGDPAVKAMSRSLKLDAFGVIGRLHSFWSWSDQHTETGVLPFTVLEDVDDLVEKRGFATELVRVGWLTELPDGGICIPNWDRNNGDSAKKRCQSQDRMKKMRDRKSNASVTPIASLSYADVTLEASPSRNQRREENIIPPTPLQGGESGASDSGDLDATDRTAIDAATGFGEFWAAYPRKSKEFEARRAWIETAQGERPDLPELLAALAVAAASDEWTRHNGQYVPSAHKWLRDQRWRDQIGSPASTSNLRKKKKEAPADWRAVYAEVMGDDCPEDADWERMPEHVQASILEATTTTTTGV